MKSSDQNTLIEFKLKNIEESSKALESSAAILEFKKESEMLDFEKSLQEKIDELIYLKEKSLSQILQVIETEYL